MALVLNRRGLLTGTAALSTIGFSRDATAYADLVNAIVKFVQSPWFGYIGNAVTTVSGAVSIYKNWDASWIGIKSASAAQPHLTQAASIFAGQSNLSDSLQAVRMVVRDEIERGRIRQITEDLRARCSNVRDFMLDGDGVSRSRQASDDFRFIADQLVKLDAVESASMFPSYAAGAAVQLLTAKVAREGREGPTPQQMRRQFERHVETIGRWAGSGLIDNPKKLAEALQPEISARRKYTDMKPFEIRVSETVVKTVKDMQVPGSNPVKFEKVSSWHTNEFIKRFKGFDSNGKAIFEDFNRIRVKQFPTSTGRPTRYAFNWYDQNIYYNATPVDADRPFGCLASDDNWEGWDGLANPNGTVNIPDKVASLLDVREDCIRKTYEAKYAELQELITSQARLIGAQSAMEKSIDDFRGLQFA